MSWSFAGTASGTVNGATTLAVPLPAGVQGGDLVLAVFCMTGSGATCTVSVPGFTRLPGTPSAGGAKPSGSFSDQFWAASHAAAGPAGSATTDTGYTATFSETAWAEALVFVLRSTLGGGWAVTGGGGYSSNGAGVYSTACPDASYTPASAANAVVWGYAGQNAALGTAGTTFTGTGPSALADFSGVSSTSNGGGIGAGWLRSVSAPGGATASQAVDATDFAAEFAEASSAPPPAAYPAAGGLFRQYRRPGTARRPQVPVYLPLSAAVSDPDAGTGTDAGETAAVAGTDAGTGTDADGTAAVVTGTPSAQARPSPSWRLAHQPGRRPQVPVYLPPASLPVPVSDPDAGTGTDGGEHVVQATDSEPAHGEDSGFNSVSDPDAGTGTDSHVIGVSSPEGSNAAAEVELSSWPAGSDTGGTAPAAGLTGGEQEHWSGPLSDPVPDTGHGAEAVLPFLFAGADTGTGTEAHVVGVYTFQPPFRWTGSQFELVLPVRSLDRDDVTRLLVLWRGSRPDGTGLRLAAAHAAGLLRFVSAGDAAACADGEARPLGPDEEVLHLLRLWQGSRPDGTGALLAAAHAAGRLGFAADSDAAQCADYGEAGSLSVALHLAPALAVRLELP